jgi:hypothetical protein
MKTNTELQLRVEPGMRVWVGGHNLEARREIERLLVGTVRPPTGSIDKAFIAPLTVDEAVHFARKLLTRLVSDGLIAVVYARKTLEANDPSHDDPSKHPSVSNCPSDPIVLDDLHEAMLDLNLRTGEPCKLSDNYSAIIYDRPRGG